MIAKCACQTCGVCIEFEAESAVESYPCPSCGSMTRLLLPGKGFKNTAATAVKKAESKSLTPEAKALALIRQRTCYKTLRGLIDVIQLLLFVLIGVVAVGSVAMMVIPNKEMELAIRIVSGAVSLALCVGCAVLVVAAKQAALLLVDIADCQIQTRPPAME